MIWCAVLIVIVRVAGVCVVVMLTAVVAVAVVVLMTVMMLVWCDWLAVVGWRGCCS